MSLNVEGGYAPQPFSAYVRMYVGGTLITLNADNSPDYLQSFRFESKSFGTGNFTLQIVDPKWDEVHRTLMANSQNVQFTFGYEGGVQSIVYKAILTSIKPSFTIDGVILLIEGTTVAGQTYLIKKIRPWPDHRKHGTKFLKISEIVKEIADENGWATSDIRGSTIEETEEIKLLDSNDSTTPVNKRHTQMRQTDMEFINGTLIKLARSKATKEAGYTCYLDYSSGDITVHFHPLMFKNLPRRYFEFMRDPNSEVISFDIDASSEINTLARQGGVETAVPYWDHITKVSLSVVKNNNTTDKEKTKIGLMCGIKTKESKEKDRPFALNIPAENEQVADIKASSHYMWFFNTAIKANMVIMGEPRPTELLLQDVITVMVKDPKGKPHPVSGNYMIASIIHEITAGSFTTTLGLVSNGQGEGIEPVKGKNNLMAAAAGPGGSQAGVKGSL